MAAGRLLIRNGTVVSMDPGIGVLDRADVLVEDGRIAAVGVGIEAADCEIVEAAGGIVMPGFVDVHRHVWQGVVAGLFVVDGETDYFDRTHLQIGATMSAEDAYWGTYLGALAAIESGVTTLVDHCNIAHTPEKGEACARGMLDARIGGIFCYQASGSPDYAAGATITRAGAARALFGPSDAWHFAEAERLRSSLFAADDGLMRFGLALSAKEKLPGDPAEMRSELERARALAPALLTQHLYGHGTTYADGRPGRSSTSWRTPTRVRPDRVAKHEEPIARLDDRGSGG